MDIHSALKNTLQETEKYFNLPEHDLQKTYAKDKWTVKKILLHLADAESVLHERIKRTIAEPKPVLWAFNQDFWCTQLDYENFPLHIGKALFCSNRQSVIYLAGMYFEKLGNREFVHSETGIRTLKNEFEKVAAHNQAHLNQIKTALQIG